MIEDRFRYIASDYMATGEGRTICLMICIPHPDPDDYDRRPRIAEDGAWDPGVLRTSLDDIATRRFRERFTYHGMGAEVMDRNAFMLAWGRFVPDAVMNMTEPGQEDGPGNLSWYQMFHFNFS